MNSFDYAVLAVYMVAVIGIGLHFHKQSSIQEFFMGGHRIPWLASAATLIATGISCSTYISLPGQSFRSDLTFLQVYLSFPLAAFVASFIFLPFFRRQNVITAYEYLEKRFDLASRLLASFYFQLFQILVLGTILAAPAILISEASGISFSAAVIIIGVVTTLYTMIGGIKGVIWTDVVQLFLFLGGPLSALLLVAGRLEGGWAQIYQVSQSAGKLRMIDWQFGAELTIWATISSLFLRDLAAYGTNQVIVQKYLTTSSIRASRKAMVWSGVSNLVIWCFFFLIGLALYAFHIQYPDRLPDVGPDRVFIRFILNEMPAGVRGLLIAGGLAAAMSTISSTLNSLSAASVVDFWNRLNPVSETDGRLQVKRSRAMIALWGMLSIGTALIVLRWGTIIQAGVKIGSFLSGSLLGLFLLGIFSRRAVGPAACVGVISSSLSVLAVAELTSISYVWYTGVGFVVCVLVGQCLSRWFFAPPQPGQLEKFVLDWNLLRRRQLSPLAHEKVLNGPGD